MKQFIAKSILCVLLSLMMVSLVQAQQKLTVGLNSGMNLSKHFGKDVSSSDFRSGLAGSVFLNYRISENFSLQPEVFYGMKGSQNIFADEATIDLKSSYWSTPVLLKYHLPIDWKLRPYFLGGPVISFHIKTEASILESGNSSKENLSDSTEKIDTGLVLGTGFSYHKLNIEVRYEMGLRGIDKAGEDITNGAVSFLVGYSFWFR